MLHQCQIKLYFTFTFDTLVHLTLVTCRLLLEYDLRYFLQCCQFITNIQELYSCTICTFHFKHSRVLTMSLSSLKYDLSTALVETCESLKSLNILIKKETPADHHH